MIAIRSLAFAFFQGSIADSRSERSTRIRPTWCLIASSLITLLGALTTSAQTVHQATLRNLDGLNSQGVRYLDSAYAVLPAELPWGGVALDGESLLLIDKSWYNSFDPPTGGGTNTFDAETRFTFVGSGIDMLHIRDNAGETIEWEIVDGGSGDTYNVVASGTIDTYTPAAAPFLESVQLVPQGTLSQDKVHMLRTRIKDTDGLGNGVVWKRRVFIDAYAVYDDVPITFDDNSNFSGNWTFSENWNQDLPIAQAYEGGRAASPGPGETIDFNFNGTSLVVHGFAQQGVNGIYNWEIDGGAGGSGTIDQSLDNSFSARWPEILVNGLSSGPHTLKITVDGSGIAGAFQPNFGFTQIDMMGVFDSGIVITEDPDFDGDGDVDGRDFLIWQRGFGTGMTQPQGDANGDMVVDGADLAIWQNGYGAPLVAASNTIPEPNTVLLTMCGTLLLTTRRRNRRSADI